MQMNRSFTRVISCLLVTIMVLGMLPAGALRANAERVDSLITGDWFEITSTDSFAVYERISAAADLQNGHNNVNVTKEEDSKPIFLGFGENTYYVIHATADGLSVLETAVTESAAFEGFYEIANADALSKWYYHNVAGDGGYTGISTVYAPFDESDFTQNPDGTKTYHYGGQFLMPNVYWGGALDIGSKNPWHEPNIVVSDDGSLIWTDTALGNYAEGDQEVSWGALANGTEFACGVENGALSVYTKDEMAAEGFNADLISLYIYAPVEKTVTTTSYAALQTPSAALTFDLAENTQEEIVAAVKNAANIVLSEDNTLDQNADSAAPVASYGDDAQCTLSGSITEAGTYSLAVSYKGVSLGSVTFEVTSTPTATTAAPEESSEPAEESSEPTEATEPGGEAAATITPENATILVGQSQTLTVFVADEVKSEYNQISYSWSSSDPAVADVPSWHNGYSYDLSGAAVGTAVISVDITGWDKDWSEVSLGSVCTTVTVEKPVFSVTPAMIVANTAGNRFSLVYSLHDSNGNEVDSTKYSFSVSSSDTTVADVFWDRYIDTYSKEGSTTLTVYCRYDNNVIAEQQVQVVVSNASYIVVVDPNELVMEIGGEESCSATVTDLLGIPVENAVVSWITGDSSVATVDANGNIKAVAPGETSVTATYVSENGETVTGSVKVTVNEPNVTVTLSPGELSVNVKQRKPITATVTAMAGDTVLEVIPTIEWISGSEYFATVSDGYVLGVAETNSPVAITAKLTHLTVNGVTYALSAPISMTADVNVTNYPMVGFDRNAMDAEAEWDIREEGETIEIPLLYQYNNLPEGVTVTVTSQTTEQNWGTSLDASVVDNILRITATSGCNVQVTIRIENVTAVDANGNEVTVLIDEESNTFTLDIQANDNSGSHVTGVVELASDELTMACETMALPLSAVAVKHGTFEVPLERCTFTYSTSDESVVRCADGKLIAGSKTGTATITVTATYTYGAQTKEASAEFTVTTVWNGDSPYALNLGDALSGIYEGTTFTLTPHVDLGTKLNTLTSYKIQWTVSDPTCLSIENGAEEFAYGGSVTYGGPMQENAGGIQYIGNGTVTLKALKAAGEVILTAKLVEVDGIAVNGVSASVSVAIGEDHYELKAADVYSEYLNDSNLLDDAKIAGSLYDYTVLEQKLLSGAYELRIKDGHTFQMDDNGLDARVSAVVGDNHIDFSSVTLNVYDTATGALVLHEGTLLPVEIPAGMLTFYEVETANVGWIPVRVTFKDYYLEDYATANTGDDLYAYAEYPTGGNGNDGYVWMYVREKVSQSQASNAVIGGTVSYVRTDTVMPGQKYIPVGESDHALVASGNNYGVSKATAENGVLTELQNQSNLTWCETRFEAVDGGYHLVFLSPYTQSTSCYLGISNGSVGVVNARTDALLLLPEYHEDGSVSFRVGDLYLSLANGTIQLTQTPYKFCLYQKVITGGTPVTVTVTVNNIRPWVGAENTKADSSTEALAEFNPMSDPADSSYNTEIHWTVDIRDVNGESIYQFTHADFSSSADIVRFKYDLYGAIINKRDGLVVKAKESVATGQNESAIGFYSFLVESIPGRNEFDLQLTDVIELTLPIIVRQDSVQIDTKVTYGLQLDNAWGDSTGYNYISVMGAGPTQDGYYISSYAITYDCDLPEDRYTVGIRTESSFGFISKGTWHEEFRVDAPLGTSSVTPYLHSITRLNGTVLILDEGEREGGPDYTIDLDPQILILRSANSDLTEIPNTGTVKATIRDKEGNQITVDALVEWTRRDPYYVTSSYVTEDGKTASKTEDVAASQVGVTSDHTLTGQHVGVTYYTVQLMKIQEPDENGNLVWVDVSKHNIADYVIVDVVNETQQKIKNVVIDYSKPIEIDITEFIDAETGYEFLGFSDLEHSLRKHSYTDFGEIEIGDDEAAHYTALDILDSTDEFYVIFQHVETNPDTGANEYTWHHYLVNVVPATVMYYETDFSEGVFTAAGDWQTVGEPQEVYQDPYVRGNVYGYDSSYLDDGMLSNGSSLLAAGEGIAKTKVSFTFTGTGFDVISRTGKQQAIIVTNVYGIGENGSETLKKTITVINKGVGELYQIPVISCRDELPHGTYRVEIGVMEGYTPPANMGYNDAVLEMLTRGNEFYFDAVRIYGTMTGEELLGKESDSAENVTVKDVYAADGEGEPLIEGVGELLIKANSFHAAGDANVTGVLYLDDSGSFVSGSTDAVATYDKIGPNNEVYLAKDQGIAFIVEVDDPSALGSIDIGAKTVNGAAVLNAVISNKAATASKTTMRNMDSATALFYDIAGGNPAAYFTKNSEGKYEAYLVIKNTGDNILSVTDIKLGFKASASQVIFLSNRYLAAFATAFVHVPTTELGRSEDGNWYYYVDGEVDTAYTGLVEHSTGTWYVQGGQVIFTHNGMVTFEGEQYYVKGGQVDTSVNGIDKRDGTWMYFVNGTVDTSVTAMVEKLGDLWYVNAGYVDFNKSGLVEHEGSLLYVRYGQHIANYVGLQKSDDGQWLYVNRGAVDYSYTGFAKYGENWWYVMDGSVNFAYTGTASDGNATYRVKYGLVDASNPIYS